MAGGEFGRPDPRTVSDFHTFDDVDSGKDAHHHTLGSGSNQASPGSHNHDGSNSPTILNGELITGSKGSASWASSVNAILVRLGAVDNST
jgi:hypothetical protein